MSHFPHLVSGFLISIGKFCDAECTIHMDARLLSITRKGSTVLTGTREPGGLWYINEPTESKKRIPVMYYFQLIF